MTATTTAAAEFVAAARRDGFRVEIKSYGGSGSWVLTLHKAFAPGDRDAYVAADGAAYSILALAPMTYPGSVWGTDGGSVGGHAGLTGGYYNLSKSGVGVRFVQAIAKVRKAEVA